MLKVEKHNYKAITYWHITDEYNTNVMSTSGLVQHDQ